MPITYSNPRMHAEIPDWPMGSNKRGVAFFSIEPKPGKGERGVRVTKCYVTGKISKPKVMTFATKAHIVDGDDGKTYIAELSVYGFVSIMQSNMQFQQETVFPRDPRHAELLALFA